MNCTKNAFGGRTPPGPAGAVIAPPDIVAVIRGSEGGKGKERVGNNKEGEEGERKEKRKGV